MSCVQPACHVPLRKGWNTWVLARVLEPDEEITAEELRAEVSQLIGLTPAGLATSAGTWFPSNDVAEISINTFLGGEAPNYTDDGALADAERAIAQRAWGDIGLRGVETIVDKCPEVTANPDGSGVTMVILDFVWRGESTQVPWPTTRWLRTPGIPFVIGAARIQRWCKSDVDWYLAEYWGDQADREVPKTLRERAEDSLSNAVEKLKAIAKQSAEGFLEDFKNMQLAMAALGIGLGLIWLRSTRR